MFDERRPKGITMEETVDSGGGARRGTSMKAKHDEGRRTTTWARPETEGRDETRRDDL
jgi:hypothetical protein